MSASVVLAGSTTSSSTALAPDPCLWIVVPLVPRRYAYPPASAPRSAMAASSVWAASVRSTSLAALRLYPAIPHISQETPSTVAATGDVAVDSDDGFG